MLIKRIIEMTSDQSDIIWDPFAGLCTTAIASLDLERECYCAEINADVYNIAVERVRNHLNEGAQCSF